MTKQYIERRAKWSHSFCFASVKTYYSQQWANSKLKKSGLRHYASQFFSGCWFNQEPLSMSASLKNLLFPFCWQLALVYVQGLFFLLKLFMMTNFLLSQWEFGTSAALTCPKNCKWNAKEASRCSTCSLWKGQWGVHPFWRLPHFCGWLK